MAEEYLTLEEVARRLKVSGRTLQRRMPALKAKGMKVVKLGQFPRIIASTIDKAMLKAAARDEALA